MDSLEHLDVEVGVGSAKQVEIVSSRLGCLRFRHEFDPNDSKFIQHSASIVPYLSEIFCQPDLEAKNYVNCLSEEGMISDLEKIRRPYAGFYSVTMGWLLQFHEPIFGTVEMNNEQKILVYCQRSILSQIGGFFNTMADKELFNIAVFRFGRVIFLMSASLNECGDGVEDSSTMEAGKKEWHIQSCYVGMMVERLLTAKKLTFDYTDPIRTLQRISGFDKSDDPVLVVSCEEDAVDYEIKAIQKTSHRRRRLVKTYIQATLGGVKKCILASMDGFQIQKLQECSTKDLRKVVEGILAEHPFQFMTEVIRKVSTEMSRADREDGRVYMLAGKGGSYVLERSPVERPDVLQEFVDNWKNAMKDNWEKSGIRAQPGSFQDLLGLPSGYLPKDLDKEAEGQKQ